MIRKLRWKFVAVCMGLVALVLSAVFGAAYHAVRQNIEDLSRQMLYQVLREDSGRGAVPNPAIEIGGDRVLLPYFTVNIWGDTAYITGGTYADLENTDTLRDILSQCLEQEAAEGTVNEYHLRYLSMDNGLYRKLAFVDMSMEQAVLRRLVRSYLLIALGAMLVLLGIAAAASRWVTRPVEKAWKQQRQFLSDASHELKTPITSIRVLADSLMGMEDVPVELYREFMTDISDEIDRENQIIEDLLMLVKMDKTAEDQMNIEQVNINGELELILKRLRPIAKRGNVELILESIREVTADVDKVKISLAITNLVENAIKYNRDSGVVRVTLDADHKYFYIKVADTGIGIPEDALEHIFERFFRVDKARSREVGGTGLGLAIAKNVIQMHHGIIDVESTVGEGTTFSVRIPLNYVPRQEAKP